jgi:hypothetical protein
MATGSTLAVTGLVACVAALALGISQTGFTIRQPEYALTARHCLSYERKGHVKAFCATTRRFCEQHVRKLSPQEKLITPCRPDLETVICWPEYPCKRIPAGLRPGSILPSPA